jgi:hypothetical protein
LVPPITRIRKLPPVYKPSLRLSPADR